MGVNGRPTRACALVANSERPSVCDQSSEPKTPQVTTAATKNARFKPTCFISTSLAHRMSAFQETCPSLIFSPSILRVKLQLVVIVNSSQCLCVRPLVDLVSMAYACVARSTRIRFNRPPRYQSVAVCFIPTAAANFCLSAAGKSPRRALKTRAHDIEDLHF